MSPEKTCRTCGSAIPADSADGLCLKCLGRLGFFPEPSAASPDGLLRLGDYELLEEIARGGMGVVYRARQLSLNRIVALKVVLHGPFSSADFVRRFRNEAQAIAALRHPNIVAIHEIGESQGSQFISLEYIDGQSFAELVRQHPLTAMRAARYLKTIAEAVEHAHRRGILHRDLKPSNVLLDIFDQPRVTDFGLAKLANQGAGITTTGEVLGSPNYMPPEHAMGKSSADTAQSDVYSLGAILYELLTGRPPFQGETLQAVLMQVQETEPVPPRRLNPATPLDLQTICLKCLQKEPARRYASAQALADDLGRFLESKPIQARPVSAAERSWMWCRRRPLLASVWAGLAAAVVLGLSGILWEWRQAELYAQGELRQKLMAQQEAAETRLNLYAADVAAASQAIQNGNFGLARRTLDQLRPEAGQADLRGFEWRYLWNLCRGDQITTLTGHRLTVTSTAFSPDGKWLATGGQDGQVKIWDPVTFSNLANISPTTNAVWSLAFSPDSSRLVIGYDRGVGTWNTTTWKNENEFAGELAASSKSGDFLATADSSPFYWEHCGSVRLFNWRTGQMLGEFGLPGRALALSADGSLLAVAGRNHGITVWNTATRQIVDEWPTPAPVWSVNFSPDGRELLSAGWSSEVSIWRVGTNAPPKTFSNGEWHVWSAVYSADGTIIATTSSDQTVRLWDATSLTMKTTLRGHESEVWSAAFSPAGKWLATGGKDHKAMLWSVANRSPAENRLSHDRDCRPLFSPDGKWLATVNPDSYGGALWGMDTGGAGHSLGVREVQGFSRDSDRMAVLDITGMKVQYWQVNGDVLQNEIQLAGPLPEVREFASTGLSPDSRIFFAIDLHGVIYFWRADTGQLLRTMTGPKPPIRNAMISQDGRYLAVSVERDYFVHLYDCQKGSELQLAGHIDFVSGLAFSPDDATLATGSVDGTIRLWSVATGETMATLTGHMEEATDVAFSPDGQTLASVGHDEGVRLWHVPTRREMVSETMTNAGMWLEFSPDGRKLAVTTDDNRLRLLEAPRE